MRLRDRLLAGLLAMPLLASGCGDVEPATPPPVGTLASGSPAPAPSATDRPFTRVAWPAAGSACDGAGYAGLLGRVEAVNTRTVRFDLCAPDGAFPARLAHPALGVVDATSVDLVATDPAAARSVPGAGAFRVDAWTGDNVRLDRLVTPEASPPGSPPPSGPPPLVVLRWVTSPAERAQALREAEVDGIDDPDAADADELDTLPEIVQLSRPGLVTAYLGFGAGRPFGGTTVRRAFAQALDHAALARDAFPAGSVPATHLAPCEVPAGCAGQAWYDVNGPAAAAALDLAKLDREAVIPLHVPDAAVPGIPDPAALAAAIRNQLAASIDVTVEVDPMPPGELMAAIADGSIDGLYLGAVASSLADPSGFLEPLFGDAAAGTVVAKRARGVPEALEDVAAVTDPALRAASFTAINEAVRAAAPLVPLVHAGSLAAYRADVDRVAVSPLGVDPLGEFIPGDRRQLVVMQPSEPEGSWCAIAPTEGSLRLCALVTPGLLAFDGATLEPGPGLATRCTPSGDATTWTCRLRAGLVFTDGKRVDAADVVASVRAQADAGGRLRAAFPDDAFAAWDALFGGPVPRPAP